jgi:hypothetical protein
VFCGGLVLLAVVLNWANGIKTSLRQRKIQHTIWGRKNVIKNRNVREERRNFKMKEEDELTEGIITFIL